MKLRLLVWFLVLSALFFVVFYHQQTSNYFSHSPVDGCRDSTPIKDGIVVMGCNQDVKYAFHIPITAFLWQYLVGFRPLLFFVGTEEQWLSKPFFQLILKTTQLRTNSLIFFVEPIQGYTNVTIAQTVRLFGAAPFAQNKWVLAGTEDDAYIITSDIDIWPLGLRRLINQVDSRKVFHIYTANAYVPWPVRFPLCYLGGRISAWQEIFQFAPVNTIWEKPVTSLQNPQKSSNSFDSDTNISKMIRQQLMKVLDENLGKEADTEQQFNFDELYFGAAFRQWPRFPEDVDFMFRGGPYLDRLDRNSLSNWKLPYLADYLPHLVDAHVFTSWEENWQELSMLLSLIVDNTTFRWVQEYFKELSRIHRKT